VLSLVDSSYYFQNYGLRYRAEFQNGNFSETKWQRQLTDSSFTGPPVPMFDEIPAGGYAVLLLPDNTKRLIYTNGPVHPALRAGLEIDVAEVKAGMARKAREEFADWCKPQP